MAHALEQAVLFLSFSWLLPIRSLADSLILNCSYVEVLTGTNGAVGGDYCLPAATVLEKTVSDCWCPTCRSFLLGLALVIAGCAASQVKEPNPEAITTINVLRYPSIDAQLGEHLYSDEKPIAEKLSVVIEEFIRKQYSARSARRDAHPKAHGCVKAEIQILETLPDTLAKGLFIPGKTYQAWIRFSNGSGDPTHADIKRDARGMAIKVLGVPGKKLLEDEAQATTQDFIMINHPVFFATDPARYLSFMDDANSDHFYRKLLIPFDLGAKGTRIALETRNSKISNPLQTRYWSMVPYQLGTGPGRRAVKYSVRACSSVADPMPKEPGHDFLRDALRNTLQNGDA